MRSKGTWVALFFVVATLIVTTVFNFAIRDIMVYLQKENMALLGPRFTVSTLISLILAGSLAIYAAFINTKARDFVEQSIVELDKVAWPTWDTTRVATFTVIVTSLIAAAILGLFDTFFGWWTNNYLYFS